MARARLEEVQIDLRKSLTPIGAGLFDQGQIASDAAVA